LIQLQPLQFVFGRKICSEETGLTENEVRTQQFRWENLKILKKATNKTPNKFTIYEWSWDIISETDHQQNHQLTTNRPPTDHHNQEYKNKRIKKDHHLDTPIAASSPDDDLIDDLSSDKRKSKAKSLRKTARTHIYGDVYLNEKELQTCLLARPDLETIREIVKQAMTWGGRVRPIKNWVKTIVSWNVSSINRVMEREKINAEYGVSLEKIYGFSVTGWVCRVYHDRKKDVKGMLFEKMSGTAWDPEFVAFNDTKFKDKITKIIMDKQMQRHFK
jgi:hypothetical protein